MSSNPYLTRIAQWLAARSGPNGRAAEVRSHLDDAAAQGDKLSVADVGSLAALSARASIQRALPGRSSKILFVIGVAALGFGLFVIAWPFASVAKLSAQSLEVLPDVPGIEMVDDSHGMMATFDHSDFALATRTYESATIESIEAELRASDFDTTWWDGKQHFFIECCGEYDAVAVHLEEVGNDVVATTTATDNDVTAVWPIALFFGGAFVAFGLLLMVAIRRTRETKRYESKLVAT